MKEVRVEERGCKVRGDQGGRWGKLRKEDADFGVRGVGSKLCLRWASQSSLLFQGPLKENRLQHLRRQWEAAIEAEHKTPAHLARHPVHPSLGCCAQL